jgi:hypothetical protein
VQQANAVLAMGLVIQKELANILIGMFLICLVKQLCSMTSDALFNEVVSNERLGASKCGGTQA